MAVPDLDTRSTTMSATTCSGWCSFPAIPCSRPKRALLSPSLLGGLTTEEIARAFLVSEPTIAQRIVRAKKTLAEKQVPFETPPRSELAARLASVLEVIYLVFNEGYAATAGEDWLRPALCEEALRLGRILAELMPSEPEVHGLVALMEIQASRAKARVGPSGEPVLLFDQNRAQWDQLLIRRGLTALERAEQLGRALGPYALQAAIAACHARARTPEETDWERIVALYSELARITPSPVVDLNRAVALGMAFGPAVGLEAVDALSQPGAQGVPLVAQRPRRPIQKAWKTRGSSRRVRACRFAHPQCPRTRSPARTCRILCPRRSSGKIIPRNYSLMLK